MAGKRRAGAGGGAAVGFRLAALGAAFRDGDRLNSGRGQRGGGHTEEHQKQPCESHVVNLALRVPESNRPVWTT